MTHRDWLDLALIIAFVATQWIQMDINRLLWRHAEIAWELVDLHMRMDHGHPGYRPETKLALRIAQHQRRKSNRKLKTRLGARKSSS